MTYRYKTRIQLSLSTCDRAGHMHDKVHAQQQQRRRVTQTLHRTRIYYFVYRNLFFNATIFFIIFCFGF